MFRTALNNRSVTNAFGYNLRSEVSSPAKGPNAYETLEDSTFVYDGWNVIAEVRSQASEVSTNLYVWGLDLSGSLQGAGGIGGLLAASLSGTNVFYSYDGNGNVTDLVDTNGAARVRPRF